jgi:hypothetical protein
MLNNLSDNPQLTSSNDEDEDKKKKQTSLASSASCGDSELSTRGYKFSEDKVSNIIGYCFGGEQNKKELDKIIDESSKISDLSQRKKYIEDEVKTHAKKFDQGIATGMTNGFANAQTVYNDKIKNGLITPPEPITIENAGSQSPDGMFGIMSNMGLNVNSDNLTTTYSQGPNGNPKVYCMTWVNRPTPEMADSNSKQNELASLYGQTLSGQDKTDFDKDIKQHQVNAKNGDPKMDKKEFIDQSKKSHQEAYQQRNQELKEAGIKKASEIAGQMNSSSTPESSQIKFQEHPQAKSSSLSNSR